MAINSNPEFFASINELVTALENAGLVELASELRDASSISSVLGEIFGEVRLVLKQVRAHAAYRRLEIRPRVEEIIDYVNRTLGA